MRPDHEASTRATADHHIDTTPTRAHWRMSWDARALVLVTAILCAAGVVTLYSASAPLAMHEGREHTYYLMRHLSGLGMGIVGFMVLAKVDAERWRRLAWPLMLLSIALLVLTVAPFTLALAPRIHGARRWVNLGMSLQTSEPAKFALVLWVAMLMVKKGDRLRSFTQGLLPFLVVVGVLDVLVMLQPDLSTAMFYTLLLGIMLFAGGVRVGHFVLLGIIAIPLCFHEMERLQYVMLRMASFLDPSGAPAEINYQLQQSLVAVGSGRLFGVGYGHGLQQMGYLPFPFSDFIASNIGEEWGFLGLLAVLVGFALYGWLGFRIARTARTPFQQLVAVGLTVMTIQTAYLHVGVIVGLLPTTGLTLPFFSFGRSNLLLSLLSTGVLVNIASRRELASASTPSDAPADVAPDAAAFAADPA